MSPARICSREPFCVVNVKPVLRLTRVSEHKEDNVAHIALRIPKALASISILACLATAACVAPHSGPQQVNASRPTVTYKYRNNDQLMEANERAGEFCDRYQSSPRSVDFGDDRDGQRYVVFECVASGPTAERTRYDSNMTYTFRTDRELMEASRDARAYCKEQTGSSRIRSDITDDSGDVKRVHFECRT